MTPTDRIPSYREFWKFYVGEHSIAINRWLHFFGTTLVLIAAWMGATQSAQWFFLMPVCGYGFAWLGHFGFEKNRPATFQYPLWSLIADFQMFAFTLIGRMGAEVEKYGKPRGRTSA